MVLICGETTIIKGKTPSMMKFLEERKRTIEIFTSPLKEIHEEPQTIVDNEKVPIVVLPTDAEMKAMFGSK